jgi:hypothetical protein
MPENASLNWPHPGPPTVPIQLRWAREAAGLTQGDLAGRLGISYQSIQKADGAPVCGHRARHLGVRTSGPVLDVRPDASGMVGPGGGGCRLLPMIHHTCRLTECRSGWAVRVPTRFG